MSDIDEKDKSGLFDKFINYILDKVDHEYPDQLPDDVLTTKGEQLNLGNLGYFTLPADSDHAIVSPQPINQNSLEVDIAHASDLIHDDHLFTGKIVSFETVAVYNSAVHQQFIANDIGHNVMLDATDVLDMGNNLVITGHHMDSVNFQDTGWTHIEQDILMPQGIAPREGFDTFIHESGAVVQIESVIHTNFDPNGAV